jgi:hypothetical protein
MYPNQNFVSCRSTLYNFESKSDLIIENETKSLHKIFMFIIIPIVSIIQLLITIFHHFIFKNNEKTFLNTLLTNILFSILPLLPISFTIFWNFIKFYGVVSIFKIFKSFNQIQLYKQKQLLQSSFLTYDATALLMQHLDDANPFENNNSIDSDLKSFSFKDNKLNTDSLKLDYHHSIETIMHSNKMKFNFKEFLIDVILISKAILFDKSTNYFNQNISFIYCTNFFFGLGSLTVSFFFSLIVGYNFFFLFSLKNFSCVDKKGVLSWPNPTAETIVLFKNDAEVNSNSINDLDNDELANTVTTNTTRNKEMIKLENFTLTNDKTDGFRLHFDDSNWLTNINLLKPLVRCFYIKQKDFLKCLI